MEHTTPPVEIFNEIKEVAKKIWQDNYSDEYGYVTEKTSRIEKLQNYEDDVMVCYRMFDNNNQQKMRGLLSEEAIKYIDLNN